MEKIEYKKENNNVIDNNFDKIREISVEAFNDAQKILNGEKLEKEYEISAKIAEIQELSKKLKIIIKNMRKN